MNFQQIFNIIYFIFIEEDYIDDKEFSKLLIVNKFIKNFLKVNGFKRNIYYNSNFVDQMINNIYTYNTFNIYCSDISVFNKKKIENYKYIEYMKKINKLNINYSGFPTRYYNFSWNFFENLKELYVYTERFNLYGIENLKNLENLVVIPNHELPPIHKEIYTLPKLKMVILKGDIDDNKFTSPYLKVLFTIRTNNEDFYKHYLEIFSTYNYPYNKIYLQDKKYINKLSGIMKKIPKLLEWIFPNTIETYISDINNFIIRN